MEGTSTWQELGSLPDYWDLARTNIGRDNGYILIGVAKYHEPDLNLYTGVSE